jgi:hypothetical protein
LAEKIPELRDALARAQQAEREAHRVGEYPLPTGTVAEAWAALSAYGLLRDSLPNVDGKPRPIIRLPESTARQSAERDLLECERLARDELWRTADPPMKKKLAALEQEARHLVAAATPAPAGPPIDAQIAEARQQCLLIAAGHHLVGDYKSPPEQLRAAKIKLRDLIAQKAKIAAKPFEPNSDDEKRLAEIESQVANLRAKMMEPENQDWS